MHWSGGWLLAGMAMALGACGGLGRVPTPPAIYDIAPQADAPVAVGVAIADLEVVSPSWLNSAAMQYRLEPTNRLERRVYAGSRWAGMPAEMVDAAFGRMMRTRPAADGTGCRLRVELDEFIQHFSAAQASSGRIELRASLLAPRSDVPLARRAFATDVPAPSADAPGGVVALREGVGRLALELSDWLGKVDDGAAARCAGTIAVYNTGDEAS